MRRAAPQLLRTASKSTPPLRTFRTTAPNQGLVSTVGFAGIMGVMTAPAIPGGSAFIEKYLGKDEYKVLAWMGGMTLFGTMASMGSGKKEAVEAAAGGEDDFSKMLENLEKDPKDKPLVFFVLGPPGAGKGTNCEKLVENYGFYHISAGDCLREERKNPNSKDGELINSYIKEGKIVPVEITIKLMLAKMEQQKKEGKGMFLIDGFPRNLNNKDGWNEVVGDQVTLGGVMFYDVTEAVVKERCLARGQAGSGRVDDNLESILKRLKTYHSETEPIIESFRQTGEAEVMKIDGGKSMDEVWAATKLAVAPALGIQK